MDYTLPESDVAIARMIRQFVADEVEPAAQEIERSGEIPRALLRKAAQLGLYGLAIPEAYGGIGESLLTSAVALEALSYGPGAVTQMTGPASSTSAIVLAGSEEQKKRYLPRLAAGEILPSLCMTEAGAGSDAAGIQTRAVKTSTGWSITGNKLYITRARYAGVFIVVALTDPEKRANGGITTFVIDKRPGIEIGSGDEQLGLRGMGSAQVHFQDCEALDSEVLGEVGGGFEILKLVLSRARLWAAARSVGAMARCLELSVAHTQQRKQFGQRLGEFQGVKFKLAEMATDLAAARLLLYHCASLMDRGIDARHEAAIAKLFATEAAARAADMAVQLHGAMGVSREFSVERIYRDVRAYRIFDGVTDIMKLIIASGVQRRGPGTTIVPGGTV